MAHDTVAVVLLVREGPQGAVVEVVGGCAVVQREGLVGLVRAAVAADVGEPVGGHRAAASRALRPSRGALAARHEENARRGVKL